MKRSTRFAILLVLSASCGLSMDSTESASGAESPETSATTDAAPGCPLKILLTNDDGWSAVGIQTMKEALIAAGHEVTLVAPRKNRSGSGAALTLAPVKVEEKSTREYAAEASPATCVLLARAGLMKETPDLVVSGTNDGPNLGAITPFSGTVGAALAALSEGLPAIAVSSQAPVENIADPAFRSHFARVAAFTVRVVAQLEKRRQGVGGGAESILPRGVGLNINYPPLAPDEIRGVRTAVQGRTSLVWVTYEEVLPGRYLPRKLQPDGEDIAGGDTGAFEQGYITVVPIGPDLTARAPRSGLPELGLEAVKP